MSHLSPEMFVDLLDGTVGDDAVPHLRGCDACRAQLAELRATWQAAVETDVPEPSPLFWDHLSRRVHEAVATEAAPAPWWWQVWTLRPFALAAAATAAVALVVGLQLSRPGVGEVSGLPSAELAVTDAPALEPLPALEDDPSIGLVADLASDLDVESALPELGLGARGAADRALSELDADERAELRRLLAEEMGTL